MVYMLLYLGRFMDTGYAVIGIIRLNDIGLLWLNKVLLLLLLLL